MAKQVKLAVQSRSEVGRNAVKKVKTAGFVPAVIYSRDQTPVNLQVSERELSNILAHAAGENFLVDLSIEGGAPSQLAIVQEVQHHPVTQRILHVDFHAVSASEEVAASIPVEAVGEAVGVKTGGGILQHLHRNLSIKALATNLPELITVDVTDLAIGQALHVKDIKLPEGVTAVDDGEVTVFLIAEPKVAVTAQA